VIHGLDVMLSEVEADAELVGQKGIADLEKPRFRMRFCLSKRCI
jgi:hypothetical protein